MNKDFLHFYNQELWQIRESAREFATAYPKIAGRLSLENVGQELCPDPFVERLLEGFAYMAARIQMKLNAEIPHVSQSLLENIAPAYEAPVPSAALVRFKPQYDNKGLASGFTITRGSKLYYTSISSENTQCTFKTSLPVVLWPIQMTSASYRSRDLSSLSLPADANGAAAIFMKFETTTNTVFSKIPLDQLNIYIPGGSARSALIHEHILSKRLDVWIRNPESDEKKWYRLPAGAISEVGVENSESLTPFRHLEWTGYRLLREYFVFPDAFLFFRLSGFESFMADITGHSMEVAITLSATEESLENNIDENSFALYCTPVINLFEKKIDRVFINTNSPGDQYHVVADKTAPTDYEIHSVLSVVGYGSNTDERIEFKAFFEATDHDLDAQAYYSIQRLPRTLSEKEKRQHTFSSYVGSEVYISLVDSYNSPLKTNVKQLGISALCTNRHLPIALGRKANQGRFTSEAGGPVSEIQCIAGPTIPQPSYSMRESSWRLISHLTFNFFTMADTEEKSQADALKEILRMYIMPYDDNMRKHVDGIVSVESKPVIKRVFHEGIFSFLKGLEVTVTMDDDQYAGTGIFLMGMILERFFARHVSMNTLCETVIRSTVRGEIMRWPARLGGKKLL